MQAFQVNPALAERNKQMIERNKAIASSGGSGLGAALGVLGSVAGGALGAPLGPLGMAIGSGIGGSLLGKGDLSGVTPEGIAVGTLTAGIGDKIKAGAEAANAVNSAAAANAVQDAATGAVANALPNSTPSLTDSLLNPAGAMSSPAGASEAMQAMTGAASGADLASMADAAKFTEPSFFSKEGFANAIMGKGGKDAFIENPNNLIEAGINKMAAFTPWYKADGGKIEDKNTGLFDYNGPISNAVKEFMKFDEEKMRNLSSAPLAQRAEAYIAAAKQAGLPENMETAQMILKISKNKGITPIEAAMLIKNNNPAYKADGGMIDQQGGGMQPFQSDLNVTVKQEGKKLSDFEKALMLLGGGGLMGNMFQNTALGGVLSKQFACGGKVHK